MGDQWPAVRRYEPLEEIGVGAYGIVTVHILNLQSEKI